MNNNIIRNGMLRTKLYKDIIFLVKECKLSKNLVDSLVGPIPIDLRDLIEAIRAEQGTHRTVRSLRVMSPDQRLLFYKAVMTYVKLCPENKNFEKRITISELALLCKILKIEHTSDIEWRADHIFRLFTGLRDKTIQIKKCKKCDSNYLVNTESGRPPGCPKCSTLRSANKSVSTMKVKTA